MLDVFTLPIENRIEWVVSRLSEFRGALHNNGVVGASATGRRLESGIEQFMSVIATDSRPGFGSE